MRIHPMFIFGIAMFYPGAACAEPDSNLNTAKQNPPKTNATQPSSGAVPQSVKGKFGDWSLVCSESTNEKGSLCSLVQALVHKDTKKLVFRLTVVRPKDGSPTLFVRAPAGVSLGRGLSLSMGNDKIYRAGFQTCVSGGCRAVFKLDEAMVKEMSTAKASTVTVFALNGKALSAQVSFANVAEGLQELAKQGG